MPFYPITRINSSELRLLPMPTVEVSFLQFLSTVNEYLNAKESFGLDKREARNVRICNIISLGIAALAFPYIFIFTAAGLNLLAVGMVGVFLTWLLLIPFLNRIGQFTSAKLVFIGFGCFVIFFYAIALHTDGGVQLMLYNYAVVPLILFKPNEVWKISLSFLYAMACLLGSYAYCHFYGSLYYVDPGILKFLFFCLLSTGFVLVMSSFVFFYITNNQAEAELEKTIDSLQDTRQQLIQASKLSSLGTMAAGMCHELNNPLTIIKGFISLVLKSGDNLDDNQRRKLAQSLDASNRMAKIINHLRTFAREGSREDLGPISVLKSIENSLILLEQQLKNYGIEVIIDHNCKSKVIVDKNQLESVFQNLIVNSKDSFLGVNDGREKMVKFTCFDLGEDVIINYEDNAGGMSREVQNQMFQPFFTTKETGEGTGLGMSIVHGIIQQHNGTITFKSTLGKGTKFVIIFPRAELESDKKEVRSVEVNLDSKPKILIIDDEPYICEYLKDVLEGDFVVTCLTDSREALSIIENEKFDLVLTDVKMPFVSGIEILDRVKKNQANTPVMIMSGHARSDKDISDAFSKGAIHIIPKPFPDEDDIRLILKSQLKRVNGG